MSNRNRNLLRLTLAATLMLHILGLYTFLLPVYSDGLLFTSRRWMLITSLGIAGFLVELAFLAVALWAKKKTLRTLSRNLIRVLARYKTLNLLFYLLLFISCSILMFAPLYGRYTPGFPTLLWAYWLTALAGSFFLKSWGARQEKPDDFNQSWLAHLGFSLLLTTFGFRIVLSLQDISTYPFTLGWSETSRYYYASLFFSERIYGIDVPPTVLHPSRYLMQAVPFLLPDSPLWLHRAWQIFLWIGTTSLTSWLLVRRVGIDSRWRQTLLFLASFLFLQIGPVYYHLQIPLILMLWGFKTSSNNRPWVQLLKSLAVFVAASAWAGISRVNWYPLPGLLAVCLYLLEKPVIPKSVNQTTTPARSSLISSIRYAFAYLVEPATWTLFGLAIAYLTNVLYIRWSGNPAEYFTSSFSSALLWYRLLPNATYLPGILPGALLTSVPFLYLIWKRMKDKPLQSPNTQNIWQCFHPLRILGIAAVLFVFFAGGLLVSIKIGGGSNLHNLDAYQALLWIIASMIFSGKFTPESTSAPSPSNNLSLPTFWAACSVAILVIFSFWSNSVRAPLPDQAASERGLALVSQAAQEASQQGEVLFISNRHLLTFGYIPGVALFPEYERVFLMEMAMANNRAYLGQLRQDLVNHRFSLIITEPIFIKIKDETHYFGEENNIWIKQVINLLRCYYMVEENDDGKFLSRELQIQFHIPNPKQNPARCPKD